MSQEDDIVLRQLSEIRNDMFPDKINNLAAKQADGLSEDLDAISLEISSNEDSGKMDLFEFKLTKIKYKYYIDVADCNKLLT